jgi:hypothetical protein
MAELERRIETATTALLREAANKMNARPQWRANYTRAPE